MEACTPFYVSISLLLLHSSFFCYKCCDCCQNDVVGGGVCIKRGGILKDHFQWNGKHYSTHMSTVFFWVKKGGKKRRKDCCNSNVDSNILFLCWDASSM